MPLHTPTPNAKQQSLSSSRLLTIIEYLSDKGDPQRLTDIALALGLTQPTALRYLRALITDGYAFQDEGSGGYGLTWKLCRAGDQIKNARNLRHVISPSLQALSTLLRTGALLAQMQGDSILCLDAVEKPGQSYDALFRIGKEIPPHAAASGKILLSGMTEAQIGRLVRTKELKKLTEKTITDPGLLTEEIRHVRNAGYAVSNEEWEENLCCISVAIRNYTGNIIAAVSVFDDASSMEETRIRNSVLPVLRDHARIISSRLGYK